MNAETFKEKYENQSSERQQMNRKQMKDSNYIQLLICLSFKEANLPIQFQLGRSISCKAWMHRSKCCSTAVLEFIQNLLLELGLSPELWSILTPVSLPTGHPLGIVPFSFSLTLDSSAAKASPYLPAFSFCFHECCTAVLLMLKQELNLHLPSFLHIERCLCLSISLKTMTRGKNLRVARKSTVMAYYNLTYPLLWSSNVCQKLRIRLPCLVHGLDIMFRAKMARSCLGDLDWNLVMLLFNVW